MKQYIEWFYLSNLIELNGVYPINCYTYWNGISGFQLSSLFPVALAIPWLHGAIYNYLLGLFFAAIIIGFESLNLTVNETIGSVEICAAITSPQLDVDLPIANIIIRVFTVNGTAGKWMIDA